MTVHTTVGGVPAAYDVPAVLKVMDGGEKVWEAQIGPYLAGDEVSYTFALQSGGKSLQSAIYSFRVRTWTALERVQALHTTTDGFVVQLGYGADASRTATLAFRSDASGAVQLAFAAYGRTHGWPAGAAGGIGCWARTAGSRGARGQACAYAAQRGGQC